MKVIEVVPLSFFFCFLFVDLSRFWVSCILSITGVTCLLFSLWIFQYIYRNSQHIFVYKHDDHDLHRLCFSRRHCFSDRMLSPFFFGALVQCFCLLCPLGVPLPFRTSMRCSFCLLDPCLRQRSVATTSTCSTSNSLSGIVSVNHSCLSACLLKTQTSVIKFQVKLIDSGIESIFTNHLLLNVVNSERNPKVLTCLRSATASSTFLVFGFFLVYTRYIVLRQ